MCVNGETISGLGAAIAAQAHHVPFPQWPATGALDQLGVGVK